MFIEFVIQNQIFSYSLEEFAQILDIRYEGACVFTDMWSLDDLAYGVPTDGPYQTNPPSPDDIISSIRIDLEGQVTRIHHEEEIYSQDHQILTREIVPTLKPLEEIIWENVFCLGGTSLASTPSPIRFVYSLTNEVPQVFQNPPNIDPHLEPFYTHQTEIINRQVQLRDEHRGGLRSIGKGLRNLWRNMKK
ncbi:hypothetical protein Tco_0410226 [Tanacetum coccineum]